MCEVSWQSSLCVICPFSSKKSHYYYVWLSSAAHLCFGLKPCEWKMRSRRDTANTVFCDLNEFSLADEADSHDAMNGKNSTLIRSCDKNDSLFFDLSSESSAHPMHDIL